MYLFGIVANGHVGAPSGPDGKPHDLSLAKNEKQANSQQAAEDDYD